MVDDCMPVPPSLRNNGVFKTATIVWILSSVILLNCCSGLMISSLYAPLGGKIIDNFSHVLCNIDKPLEAEELWQFWNYNYTSRTLKWSMLYESGIAIRNLSELDPKKLDEHLGGFQDPNNKSFSLLSVSGHPLKL
jgi:hypothetical protein